MSNKNTKSEDFYLRFEEQLLESQDWPGMYMYKFIVKDGSDEIDKLLNIEKLI